MSHLPTVTVRDGVTRCDQCAAVLPDPRWQTITTHGRQVHGVGVQRTDDFLLRSRAEELGVDGRGDL